MGGRGRGRSGRGNGGRGGRGGRGNNRSRSSKESVKKFNPYTQSNGKRYATYTTVVEKLKLKIEKEFDQADDIIWSIDHGRLYDLETVEPQLIMSTKANKEERQAENTKASMVYTEDMKAWKRRKETFRKNTMKTKAIILEEFLHGANGG